MSASCFRLAGIVASLAAMCLAAGPSAADHQPSIVAHNPRGAPFVINGFDATGAIIEGDWGLYRPGAGLVTVYPSPVLMIFAVPPPPHYFPATGRPPGYGRHEVEPRGWRPAPGPSYHRSWSTEGPARTVISYPPVEPPEIIEAAPERFKRRDRRRSPRLLK